MKHSVDGRPASVTWLRERPSPHFLSDRGVSDAPSAFAVYTGNGFVAINAVRPVDDLQALAALIGDTTRSMLDRHEAIEAAIDVDAALRFLAAMDLCAGGAPQPVWIWHPVRARWLPVLDDFRTDTTSAITDPILRAIASEPAWMVRKGGYFRAGRVTLLDQGELAAEYDRLLALLDPALKADRNKLGTVVDGDTTLYRVPYVQVRKDLEALREALLNTSGS